MVGTRAVFALSLIGALLMASPAYAQVAVLEIPAGFPAPSVGLLAHTELQRRPGIVLIPALDAERLVEARYSEAVLPDKVHLLDIVERAEAYYFEMEYAAAVTLLEDGAVIQVASDGSVNRRGR